MKKFILALGVGTLIMFYVFNLGHAVNDYGIVENSMTLSVLAQSGSNGGGSGSSGGGSTSGGGSSYEWICSLCHKGIDDCTCEEPSITIYWIVII